MGYFHKKFFWWQPIFFLIRIIKSQQKPIVERLESIIFFIKAYIGKNVDVSTMRVRLVVSNTGNIGK